MHAKSSSLQSRTTVHRQPQAASFRNGWMVELLQLSRPIARCNGIHHHAPKEQARRGSMSSIQAMTSRKALVLGSLPDGKAEGDLVDEVCKVVDEVQAAVIDTTHEVAKEVASWVNRPTCSDNETHGAERGLGELVG